MTENWQRSSFLNSGFYEYLFVLIGNYAILFKYHMESWQSGNAPDSKSGEPANTGAQVQILYSPY